MIAARIAGRRWRGTTLFAERLLPPLTLRRPCVAGPSRSVSGGWLRVAGRPGSPRAALCLGILACAAGTSALPIDSLYARGDSSINIAWTPDSANTRPFWYARCCPSDTNYSHCDFLPGLAYRGEAYSYGGEDPWMLFRERLAQGALAGSHDCHYTGCGDPSDSVTGTDCSGFVCYLWGVPRVTTGTLATSPSYVTIAKSSLAPGDALVKASSHSLIVVDAGEYPELLIWESYGWPVNGCRERMIDLSDTYWDAYVARRNPDLTSVAGRVAGQATVASAAMRAAEFYTLQGRRVEAGPGRDGTVVGTGLVLVCDREGPRVEVRFIRRARQEADLR